MDDATFWLKRRVERLEKRLENYEAITSILKANDMHEPDCITLSPAQKLYPMPCNCWLATDDLTDNDES
jgi:hypothetical protein